VDFGDTVAIGLWPADPEPELPADLMAALRGNSDAREIWDSATTLARVDWIY
jgi:hypothetical protein